MQQWQHAWSSSTCYQRRNAARADPNSCSLFKHNYAEEENNDNKERRKRIKWNATNANKTESVLMMNNMKWETKSSVSAFSYWELSYAIPGLALPPSTSPSSLLWSTHHYMIFFFQIFFCCCFHKWQWQMAEVISVNRCGPGFCLGYRKWFSQVNCKRNCLKELNQLKPKCFLGCSCLPLLLPTFWFLMWRSGIVLERVQMLLKQTTMTIK